MKRIGIVSVFLSFSFVAVLAACSPAAEQADAEPAPEGPSVAELRTTASSLFGSLPADAAIEANPSTEARVALGRKLYADPRLSLADDISCNSCHQLDGYGVDGEPTSPGHEGQRGGRNSPTTLNAAFHVAQFWDGRSPDVEDQAKGPVLNPIEMAMPSAEAVEEKLRAVPGYAPLFAAAFPGEEQPVTFDNMALAIAAFERKLVTPAPFDAFVGGDDDALTAQQLRGLQTFVETGCITCHVGPTVGGRMFQKLGLVKPYETEDQGRFEVTGNESDRGVFKVPSLRNVAKTGPWFHDGSITDLSDAIGIMAEHQLGKTLGDGQIADIEAFLGSLTGTLAPELAAAPTLP